MTAARLRAAIVGGGIAILGAAAIAVGSGAQAVAADPASVSQAKALNQAHAPDAFDAASRSSGVAARERAAKMSGQVPLPRGKAFNDIDWDNGDLSDADIQGLLEFNAACKWWLADADAPTKETAGVVAAIPGWPTMRDGMRHDIASAMVPGGDAKVAADTVTYCRESVR